MRVGGDQAEQGQSAAPHFDEALGDEGLIGEGTTFRIEVAERNETGNSRQRWLNAAQQMNISGLEACRSGRLFFVHGRLTLDDARQLAATLLADPVTEQLEVAPVAPPGGGGAVELGPADHLIDVTLLPGVTDPAADNLVRAAHLMGLTGVVRAATGQRYRLTGDLPAAALQRLATGLFANPVIQRYRIDAAITPPFVAVRPADDTVEIIPLREADDAALLAVSQERRLALDLAEMTAVRDYFRAEERDPTDAELEMLAQTWSEHCVHKTFKAIIDYTGPDGRPQTIDGLLKSYIRAATDELARPWVRSAFVDNAGIVAFDDRFDLAFKVETHNHPSALEPFGGANTGVGGVVRDVLGVSARPIANTDILCFGPPDLPPADLPAGVLHPRRIADGVVHGIEDYGNKMGIPTVNGAILYDRGYTANPLVYCGCLGILPRGSHPVGARDGDLIVAVGGRTGRDGLRGATFSSMEMDVTTSDVAGSAVQIGHPIQEKQVQELILRARDEQLYSAITDCGAGGFSSAVGEMAEGLGARVYLERAPLKYPGLRPWEIWLSEAQERMVLAVPPANWPRLQALAAGQDVEVTALGEFTASGRLQLTYDGRMVGDIDIHFLHDGLPQRRLTAAWSPPAPVAGGAGDKAPAAALLALLAHPNIRSKEGVIRRYDHEVQGGTAVKPLTGAANHGPANAAVLVPLDTQLPPPAAGPAPTRAVALANGICPQYGALDPYAMAWAAIDEALRNAVAAGTDPDQTAILDNFCWGNPNLPDRLGALVRCAQGCHDAAVAYGTPFISGKDSLNNEYTGADGRKHAIPGTLLVSALGIVPDVAQTATPDLKQAGDFLFVIGDTRAELGGSHYGLVGGAVAPEQARPPQPVDGARERFRALHRALRGGLVRAVHDCAEGGLAVTLAEMCLAGRIGAEIELRHVPAKPYLNDESLLFGESLSRFVVEVAPEREAALRALLTEAGIPHACVGVVVGERLRIHGRFDHAIIDLPIAELELAWRGEIAHPQHPPSARDYPSPSYPVAQLPASSPPILILHANGTNRDREAALACGLAGGAPEIVHINQLLAGERRLADYHMLVIPGGFSYGDDLGAGVLWAANLEHALGDALREFVTSGRPLLGICNGFQVLVKAGLLPRIDSTPRTVTLTYNEHGRFECRWVYLQPNPASNNLFTAGLDEPIYCPVAHGEGRLAVRDAATAAQLEQQGLIALTYMDGNGRLPTYPANPNGSVLGIAGLGNPAGNVLGLMPHPEDHIFPWQHPRWHRGEQGLDGLRLFRNALRHS